MLNLQRLAPGSEGYYLDQVVSGIEDYYAEGGEAPGYWLASSDQLGLDGAVESDNLRSVLTGHDPATGERLHHAPNRKVPGWDLTFRAPKSVSILWGLSSPVIADEVVVAHERAITVAVEYLEAMAAFTRTGRNGVNRVETAGFVAAGFRHRTSRDGDPLLHTHVLVANSVRAADGRWRTIDAVALYDHARTAGYLYAAHLRHELTARLGVGWGPIENGLADIAGVTTEVIDLFSKRREQIEAQMAEWGLTSAKAAQVSTLVTRRTKDPQPERTDELRRRWIDEAESVGWSTGDQRALLAGTEAPHVDTDVTSGLFELLSSAEGLTERASTFDRRDVIRRLIDELPAGIDTSTVSDLADRYLAHPEVVAVGATERCGTRYSTAELLRIEAAVLHRCSSGLATGRGWTDPRALHHAIEARPSLGHDQERAITQLCQSGNAVDVVIAPPGTGKTFSLDAAREAWQRSGQRVMGCALSAAAAHQLQAGSGIVSSTIETLRIDLARGDARLDAATVLVIDEAGMVGTRSLAALIEGADRSGAKVVLVGDTRQLPEIDAGGVLRSLERTHPVITLDRNRRQEVDWERVALDAFRRDDVDAALRLFRDHEALVVGPNADVVREVMVTDWWNHRAAGDRAVMMASRNIDVDDLNRRARSYLADAHQLHGESMIVEHRPYQVGDTIVCLRNDRRRGLRNGTVGEIVTLDHEQRSMLIDTTDGLRRIRAPYLEQGWVRHGYAITIHKAQGITADHGLLLASDRTYNEAGYVGISRGTRSNRIYAVSDEAHDPEHQAHGRNPADNRDPFDLVAEALKTSAAKDLATPPEPDHGIDLW